MNKNSLMILISTSVIFLSTSLQAEIYKWTDAKGVTHYTATPPPREKLKTKTKIENIEDQIRSAAGRYKAPVKKAENNDQEKSADVSEQDNKLSPPDAKLISYCKNQRKNLSNLKENYRNVWVDTDGKKTNLDQKQRQEKVTFLINKIRESCKGI